MVCLSDKAPELGNNFEGKRGFGRVVGFMKAKGLCLFSLWSFNRRMYLIDPSVGGCASGHCHPGDAAVRLCACPMHPELP